MTPNRFVRSAPVAPIAPSVLGAAGHLPLPGIGLMRGELEGSAWLPVDYTTAR